MNTNFHHFKTDDVGFDVSQTQWALPLHVEWHDDRDYFVIMVRLLCVSLVMVRWRM